MEERQALRNINLNSTIKKSLLKTYVCSVVFHGSKIWTIWKSDEKKLLAFEVCCIYEIILEAFFTIILWFIIYLIREVLFIGHYFT